MRAIAANQHKTALFLLSRSNPKRLLKGNKDQQTVFHLAGMAGGDLFSYLRPSGCKPKVWEKVSVFRSDFFFQSSPRGEEQPHPSHL